MVVSLPSTRLMPRQAVSLSAGRVIALLLCSVEVWGLELGFSCSPQLNAERETAAELHFSQNTCSPYQRHRASSGLLAKRQLCQTPLDTFQGQHESGGSTDPRMEWGPRSLVGQSQVCRESAWMPSVLSCRAEDGKEWDAEDTPVASWGPSGLRCWVLLGCSGAWGQEHRSEMLRRLHRRQADSVKSNKDLRPISLPDQSWHKCVSISLWVASSTFVSACIQSLSDTDSTTERSTCCLLNSKGCSLQKNNLCCVPAVPVQSICGLDSLRLRKQGAFLRHLLCQCWAVVSENAGWSSCIPASCWGT